jgi:hypothetical protein
VGGALCVLCVRQPGGRAGGQPEEEHERDGGWGGQAAARSGRGGAWVGGGKIWPGRSMDYHKEVLTS